MREACAAAKVLVGRSSKCCHAFEIYSVLVQVNFIRKKKIFLRRGRSTRVVCRTFASRGKSFTPESRMDMLEERNWVLERREETQDDKGLDIIVRP